MAKEKWTYRLIFELDPSFKTEDCESVFDGIKFFGKGFGITFDKPESMGTKELAYEINGFNRAGFWVMRFLLDKKKSFDAFNVFLNREKKIIRYLILKI